jgi:lysophospholipase L1-like esterase
VADTWSWRNEEIDRYNAAATELMRSWNVTINDLHAVVAADHDQFLSEDMLHLSVEGVNVCARAVAAAVEAALDQAGA